MGLEAACRLTLNGQSSDGRAHCGDGEIEFRGDYRLRWKWSELTRVGAADGVLEVVRGPDRAEFHLGDAAAKWESQIKNPKSRIEKLGLKPGQKYAIWGEFDEAFPEELSARAGAPGSGAPFDAIFVRFDEPADLVRLLEARRRIVPNGMIWAVWPKGRKEFREDDIRSFGLANGLVDVKVASFSSTLSALKLVIPVHQRTENGGAA